MSDKPVTCGKECCVFFPMDDRISGWRNSSPRDDTGRIIVRCCPQTGERLTVVDGQPVVEPRPSPSYVRLLEESVQAITAGAAEVLHSAEQMGCVIRVMSSLIRLQTTTPPYAHEDALIGCLRALAAEREKESDDRE